MTLLLGFFREASQEAFFSFIWNCGRIPPKRYAAGATRISRAFFRKK
jgi:hypothetical protein